MVLPVELLSCTATADERLVCLDDVEILDTDGWVLGHVEVFLDDGNAL